MIAMGFIGMAGARFYNRFLLALVRKAVEDMLNPLVLDFGSCGFSLVHLSHRCLSKILWFLPGSNLKRKRLVFIQPMFS